MRLSVKRSLIKTLRFKKHNRIVIFNRADQQTFSVVGIRRDYGFQPCDMSEQSFGTLAVSLAAKDSATCRSPDRKRSCKLSGRAVAKTRRLRNNLIESGVDIVRKLDLDNGAKPVRTHANSCRNDAALSQRRIEDPGAAIFLLQSFRTTEDSAEIADVFSEDQ